MRKRAHAHVRTKDDYLKSNLTNTTLGYDWRTYASNWRRRITVRFRDAFMLDPKLAPLFGSGWSAAEYSEFEVEGTTAYFGRWPILRDIMTPRKRPASTGPPTALPPTIRYAKVDMYVTRPEEWDVGAGSWHGLDWLSMVIPSQIAAGDTLYSPFVSAGWSAAEEHNVRPAQYLGLLKCAAATGAEYFYAGVFSPADSGLFSRSQNWAWAAAVPSYAQAITQLWADLLDDGTLLEGDMPMPPVNYNLPPDIPPPISYRFWSGSQSIPVYIRQSITDPTVLLVVGTAQPQSSVKGNVQTVVNGTVQLPPPATQGLLTSFEFRRQGSTYTVKIDRASGSVSSVVQLDRWHEESHPWWWSRDLMIEAELHDAFRPRSSFGSGASRASQTEGAGAGTEYGSGGRCSTHTEFPHDGSNTDEAPTDLTSFTSFVTLQAVAVAEGAAGDAAGATRHGRATLAYTVQPRCPSSNLAMNATSDTSVHQIFLRLRSRAALNSSSSSSSSSSRNMRNPYVVCATLWVNAFAGEACVAPNRPFEWVQVFSTTNEEPSSAEASSDSSQHRDARLTFGDGSVQMLRDAPTTIRIAHKTDRSGGNDRYEARAVLDVDSLNILCI